MKEWRFLLQKDGDRSWLPLESSDASLPEGRYRIVAQTGQAHADVNIRICHLATGEEPPKRRIQKRTNRTNQSGLIVVVPFTQLQAGIWEFACFLTDPMSDLLGDTLHHAVRLQVERVAIAADSAASTAPVVTPLATDEPTTAVSSERRDASSEPAIAMEPPDSALAMTPGDATPVADLEARSLADSSAAASPEEMDLPTHSVEIAQSLGISMDRLVAMTDQLSHQLVAEIFQEFNLVSAPESESSAAVDEASDSSSVVSSAPVNATNAEFVNSAEPEQESVAVAAADLTLVLAQSSCLARRGEALRVEGLVSVATAIAAQAEAAATTWIVQSDSTAPAAQAIFVQLELRDPQTSTVLHRDRLEFSTGALPWAFGFDYDLPEHLSTHLVLGEVTLGQTTQADPIPLMNALFTVTIDPESLVAEFHKINAVLADSAEIEELPEQVAQFSARLFKEKAKPKLDMAFLDITAPSESPNAPDFDPTPAPRRAIATSQILPPKLYEPEPETGNKRPLQLPTFRDKSQSLEGQISSALNALNQGGTATLEPGTEAAQRLEHSLDKATANVFALSEAELDRIVVADPIAPTPDQTLAASSGLGPDATLADAVAELKAAIVGEEPGEMAGDSAGLPPESEVRSPAPAPPLFEAMASPIQTAFQALHLQDRFLERLNSLATDSELSTLLKLMHPEVLVEQAVEQGHAVVTVDGVITSAPDAETMATNEVVVLEDDPIWQEWLRRAGSKTKRTEPEVRQPIENPLLLPEDQPVPVPQLEVLTSAIIAGKTLRVQVKLPYLRPKVYVKLWVNDRQTRTLLDGPRWLVDFFADGFGGMEATTQFTAPLGSLDVRLEAIAVEMQTQRESQKVGVDLTIEPAEIPDDLFDGIDLDF